MIIKERPGGTSTRSTRTPATNRPVGEVYIGGTATRAARRSSPPNTWTHLAATYDGSVLAPLRQRRPGRAQLTTAGSIVTSTGPLRIGGNTIWGEWFSGLIDEVRIYNRALTPTEIQADMNAAITQPRRRPRRPRRAR